MNLPFSVPVIFVDSEWRGCTVIPAAELSRILEAEDIIHRGRCLAAEYLQTARRQRQRWRAKNRRHLLQRQRAQRRHYAKCFQQAREKGAAAAIGWMVEQHGWQQQVYRHLTQQIVQQLALRLMQMSASFPWEQLLEAEVMDLYREFQHEPALTLRVSPRMRENLPETLKTLPVSIESSPDLSEGSALLENHLMRIELKLPHQLEMVCNALNALTWEQLNEPD
ncbi:hypothetical protein MUA02_01185 [Enterobacteriaceae bacterium H20N1]|uniref:Uncharacterized protein n=1 Tax=Dryocola boscaweniae TaxID=2925397 RepID=A0A9X3AMF4_9ENTR|nr:hypothetical protein [Dryocola boscaweniae]MCT4700521.1 hypothetical protein [Dryocola boscaweniae]MCT4717677.1 hypothetical protein [Dryocola boscaweniae]